MSKFQRPSGSEPTTSTSSNAKKQIYAALVMASECFPVTGDEATAREKQIKIYTEVLSRHPSSYVCRALESGIPLWKWFPKLAEIEERVRVCAPAPEPPKPNRWQEKQMAGWDHAEIERALRTSDLAPRAKAEGWLHGLGAFIGDHHRHPAAQEIPAIMRSQREATDAAAARANAPAVNATPLGGTLRKMADAIWRGMKGQEEKWSALVQ